MKRALEVAVLTGLIAFGATSVEGAEPVGDGDAVGPRIVVVNESVTPVRVYVEDADGRQYELGRLERGRTKAFEAPGQVVERGDFRLRVDPGYYAQRVPDPDKIATRALDVRENETVILWLERDLSRSTVEIRAG